ncbi:MAG: NAD(P)H-dependent oxidoreductase [Propionibacteriaceae bacterium]|nr:NAD(P)H-dependent oxidoreductase [Propionibacteriaceae bacterium]
MKILTMLGSLRAQSSNGVVLNDIERLIRVADPTAELTRADIGSLPLFNQDDELELSDPVRVLKDQIVASDAILILTPEYNRALPGVLKNALDWASRPWGHNSFAGKPVAIGGASPGAIGTALAQADLRKVLAFLDARVMAQPELYVSHVDQSFDIDGRAFPSTEEFLTGWVDSVLKFFENGQ